MPSNSGKLERVRNELLRSGHTSEQAHRVLTFVLDRRPRIWRESAKKIAWTCEVVSDEWRSGKEPPPDAFEFSDAAEVLITMVEALQDKNPEGHGPQIRALVRQLARVTGILLTRTWRDAE